MNTSDAGLDLIRRHEGLRLVAYRDGGGVWTIGYGHTAHVSAGQRITEADAERLLIRDVGQAEQCLARHVSPAALALLPQPCFDALIDFLFNLGEQGLQNPRNGEPTGLARALDARAWWDVPAQLRRWVYDNHKQVAGLVQRREDEVTLWNQGIFV